MVNCKAEHKTPKKKEEKNCRKVQENICTRSVFKFEFVSWKCMKQSFRLLWHQNTDKIRNKKNQLISNLDTT